MLELFIFLRGLAIGMMASLILVSLIYSRRHYAGRTLIFFAFCVCCYLLAPLLYEKSDWFYLTDPFSNATPIAFLLLTQALFEEHAKPARSSVLVGLFYMLLTYSGVSLRGESLFGHEVGALFWQTGRIVMFCVLLYAIFSVIKHWREDLIEPRRFLRLVITCVVGFSIMVVVLTETIFGYDMFPLMLGLALAHTILIIGFIVVFSIGLLLLGQAQFVQTPTLKENPEPSAADKREVEQILSAMQTDKLYRDMELSIRSLATGLNIPEHRLRKHINSQLGYRNFNDFLNRYRISEVTEKLGCLEMSRTPVLTIAMEAGYRSLTTFNKAFKALEGITPKEYRQKQLQNS